MILPLSRHPVDIEAYRKRVVRSLRFLLLLAVIAAAYPVAQAGILPWRFWLAAGLLFASNIAYHFESTRMLRTFRLSAILFLFDTALLAYLMIELGERSSAFFVLYALTILMAAINGGVRGTVLSTALVGALYTLFTLYGKTDVDLLSAAFATRLVFFFVLALFVGTLAGEVDRTGRAFRMADLAAVSAGIGVVGFDEAGVITTSNSVVEGLFGYRSTEIVGRRMGLLTSSASGSSPVQGFADVVPVGLAENSGNSREVVGRRKDGSSFPMEVIVHWLPSGEEGMYVALLRDLTGRGQGQGSREVMKS